MNLLSELSISIFLKIIFSFDPDLKENIVLRNILIDDTDNKFIHDFLN